MSSTVAGRWTVRLDTESFGALEPDLERFMSDATGGDRAATLARMVIEEVVRNLIEHTPPYAIDESADVAVDVTDDAVVVVIDDSRPPFDPADGPALDVDAPLEARRPGGMGLHLIRALTDDLTYERQGERNHLRAVLLRR